MDTVNEALNKKLYPGVNTDVLKVRRRSIMEQSEA